MMSRWSYLGCAILLEVTASLSLKAALELPALYSLVVVGYAGSFVCLSGSLRRGMQLGVGYGIWAATGVALTAILSALIFGEPFRPLMGAGIGLIVVGVLLVELGSHAANRRGDAGSSLSSSDLKRVNDGKT